MENHPIPQDVTGFQFKLIGNMTVKQFAYLATGVVVAWILLQLPLTLFIKIPLCAFFAILGVGLAFVPISGRPMDLMIGNFIKALFRPTQFLYEKKGTPLYFSDNYAPTPTIMPLIKPLINNPISPPKDKLKEYLESTPAPVSPTPTVPPSPVQTQEQIKPIVLKMPKDPTRTVNAPDSPNLITGVTRDSRNNPLPNILIEVKDEKNNPVRAFKTNELGRFASATPLINGVYAIVFEDPKGQNKFDPQSVNVTGEIIAPVIGISIDTRELLRRSLFATNK